MATILQMTEALINAHNAGDEKSARVLAAAIKERKAKLGEDKPIDPTAEMSAGGKLVAGFGKAFADIGRVFDSPAQVDEARKLDAKLMDSGWAKAGNIAGNIAAFAPAALIPGANTVLGSAAVGGVAGALQPVGTGESRIGNIATGGAFGAAVPAAILAGKTAKALAFDPFRKSGQEAIAGRVLQQFAKDPTNITANQMGPRVLPTLPTLAESSGDEGIAQLQRVLMTQNPQVAARLASRESANNAARVSALSEIAGDVSKREFFDTARETTANALYGSAYKAGINPKKWAKVEGRVSELMKRPVMQQAQNEARRLAADAGVDLTNKEGSLLGLHWMKKALDDMLDKGKVSGIGKVDKRNVTAVRDELIGVLDTVSPKYAKARAAYEEMSRPLNQMDVGQRLLDKTTSALRDFNGNPKMYGESFARAMRDEAGTAAKATGFKGATLESVMSSEQMAKLRAIESELSAVAAAREGGKVSGSPTAQYLVGQDILRKTAGPLGLPQKWLEGQFAQNFGARPFTAAYRVPEERIMGLLGDAMLDPQIAAGLLAKASKKGPLQTVLQNNPKMKTALEVVAASAQVAPLAFLPAQR